MGVQFQDEEEVALFIPGSCDVLLCTAVQWQSLRAVPSGGATGSFARPLRSDSVLDVVHGGALKAILLSLGALLA